MMQTVLASSWFCLKKLCDFGLCSCLLLWKCLINLKASHTEHRTRPLDLGCVQVGLLCMCWFEKS